MPDEPLSALLENADHAEALRFALYIAYASGWSDAFDTHLTIDDARLAALVESVGVEWQTRLVKRRGPEPAIPVWLAQLAEGHTPEPWGES